MGGSESKGADQTQSGPRFTDEEKFKVFELFKRISQNEKFITEEHFLAHVQPILGEVLGRRLFTLMSMVRERPGSAAAAAGARLGEAISQQQFSKSLLMLLKSSLPDKCHTVKRLSASHGAKATGEELVQHVTAMLKSFQRLTRMTHGIRNWELKEREEDFRLMALCMLEDLFHEGPAKDKGLRLPEVPPPDKLVYGSSDLEDWLSKSVIYLRVLEQVIHHLFCLDKKESQKRVMHSLVLPTPGNVDWERCRTVLSFPALLFLNFHLPPDLQQEWRFLFSNHLYGDSFTQLVKFIRNKGPTLLIVRDKEGAIFGGFAHTPWNISPKFQGDSLCFLFSLQPHFGVYTTTGYNENFMYFNQHVQTMPNGLGMGGQLEYFGLWIDQSFNQGHSKAGPRCTTYGSPQLSASPDFTVDTVEVWGLGPERKPESDLVDGDCAEDEEGAKRSVLDKDPGAKAMLELIGKPQVSEGLRDAEEDQPTPEHNKVISLY